jgi:ubiquinone/menaquinone biosynthesis C-methylase UbiE
MKKISSIPEFLVSNFDFRKKFIADVGCGNGSIATEIAKAGAIITGIDKKSIISSADAGRIKNLKFLEGKAEKLPFGNSLFDYVLYSASFHHVPVNKMESALAEALRVLKLKGRIIFIEPVAITGTYYSIARHYREEKEIQKKAYNVIKKHGISGLKQISEDLYYMLRDYAYFEAQIRFFEKNKAKRDLILEKARNTLRRLYKPKTGDINKFRIKSVIRINVLEKLSEK